MKTKFLILFFILFLSLLAFAQNDTIVDNTIKGTTVFVNGEEYSVIKKSQRKDGWILRPEISGGFFQTNEYNFLFSDNTTNGNLYYCGFIYDAKKIIQESIKVNFGYNINPYVYLGMGVGLCNYNKSLSMPIYINPRIYLNNRVLSTYIDLKFGYSFYIKPNEEYKPDVINISNLYVNNTQNPTYQAFYYPKGICFAVEFGCEYKHSSLGLSFNVFKDMTEQYLYMPGQNIYAMKTKSNLIGGVMLNYGYSFYNLFSHKDNDKRVPEYSDIKIFDTQQEVNEVSIIHDTIFYHDTIYMPKMELVEKYYYITLDAAYNNYGQLAYGLTVGGVKKYGCFVSVATNFYLNKKYDLECGDDLIVHNNFVRYNGKTHYSSISGIIGLSVRINEPLVLKIGAGFGMKQLLYETTDGRFVKNTDASINGVEVSLGLQCKLGRAIISLDGNTTNGQYYEARLGLGFYIKNKSHEK